MVRSFSSDQLFVSTHSPDLLDGFTAAFAQNEPKELNVYAFDSKAPANNLLRVRPEVLHDQLEEGWRLGDLYRIGEPQLGGWPW
ncbi:hypothetical protein PCURB6_40980 [Paenibacillus curdlanolyticus]|nr:hypothetical protein PCURB6_40980 [Paenibacillus curdlanolyticus]